MPRDIDLGAYRLVVRFTLLASVALVVFGLYRLLQRDFLLGLAGMVLGVLALLPSQLFAIRPDPAAQHLLFLLSKPDCSLCDEAHGVLRKLVDGTPFTIQVVNIEEDRRLRRRFKEHIPVVIWQGEELARLRLDPDAMRARLDSILSRTLKHPAPSTS
ncbi:MAG: glutaredoxin family protein [Euryarchaeota archaeon]|nr:glutaredoxin family protein [Euryarchaeota archaeon]